MIFALFILFIFAGLLAFANFSAPTAGQQQQAQTLAENMATWHQAAMLQARDTPPANCLPAGTVTCAKPLNASIWSGNAPMGRLASNWPGYNSAVRVSNTSGWQSFYLRSVNSLNPAASGSENYVLTVFRGYGGGSFTTPVGGEAGLTNPANFVQGLSAGLTERVGLGLLVCDVGVCRFSRSAIQTSPSGTDPDTALAFNTSLFSEPTSAVFFTGGITAETALNNRPAMMTRVP